MLLVFGDDLERQEIHAVGAELPSVMGRDRAADGRRIYTLPAEERVHVVTIEGPLLVTDAHRIAQLPPTLRDTVFKLYESLVRTTIYDGTRIDFEQHRFPGVWGPSIDTLICCRALGALELDGVRRAVEVGSGSGFIAKHLLARGAHLEELTLIDLNPHAIRCAREHIDHPQVRFVEGDATGYLVGRRFDLMICNPPYIPRPAASNDNPYEGTGLMRFLLERLDELLEPGGRLVTIVSSLSRHLVERSAAELGRRLRWHGERDVPLKVCNVLNNPSWIDHLVANHGLQAELRDGYEYWQRIGVVEIEVDAG